MCSEQEVRGCGGVKKYYSRGYGNKEVIYRRYDGKRKAGEK